MDKFGMEALQLAVHCGVDVAFHVVEHWHADAMPLSSDYSRFMLFSLVNLTIFGHYYLDLSLMIKFLCALGITCCTLYKLRQENETLPVIWNTFVNKVWDHYQNSHLKFIFGHALTSALLAKLLFEEPFAASIIVGSTLAVASYLCAHGGASHLLKAAIASLNLMIFICRSLFEVDFAQDAANPFLKNSTNVPSTNTTA